MVLYFSGTGNTRYVAEGIAAFIGDKAVSMNELIKSRTHKRFYSEKPYVICAPIYAWRFPRIAESFISKSDFSGSSSFYFVATCDSQTGDASGYLKKICEEKGGKFCGFSSVAMPENYIVMYDAPSDEEKREILDKAYSEIKSIARTIVNGEKLRDKRSMPFGGTAAKVVNPLFYSFFVSADKFYATDKCVTCGKCAEVCLINNIVLKEGKPMWFTRCTHCMACINGCPVQAIEYGINTVGKARYFNDEKFIIRD